MKKNILTIMGVVSFILAAYFFMGSISGVTGMAIAKQVSNSSSIILTIVFIIAGFILFLAEEKR